MQCNVRHPEIILLIDSQPMRHVEQISTPFICNGTGVPIECNDRIIGDWAFALHLIHIMHVERLAVPDMILTMEYYNIIVVVKANGTHNA